jgi:subfamily B ATP-binding cassette protein MsbA
MIKLLRYYLPYKRNILLAVGSNFLMSIFMVVSIPVLQPFLQILFQDQQPTAVQAPPAGWSFKHLEQQSSWFFHQLIVQYGREQALMIVCFFLVFVFFGKNLFRYLSQYFLAPVRNGIVRDLRQKLMDKILILPLSYFSEERKGDLMSRISSDVQEIEWSIVSVMELVAREPLVILGSIAFMVFVSPQLLLFVLALMVFSGLIIGGIGRTLRRQSGDAQHQLGNLGALIEETLGGLRIIKGFNAEQWQGSRYLTENDRYVRTMTGLYRRKDLASPLSEFMGICVVAILLWFGAKQVFAGSLSAATFLTFLYAFYNVIEPAKALSGALYSVRKGMGAVERVQEVLDAEVTIRNPENPVQFTQFSDQVEFRDVHFKYQNSDRAAVSNINLVIPRGKIVALVGASGAGKSTLADLLPRFYDVSAGGIFMDGVDIRQLRLEDLRSVMGIVSQDAILFNDTVRNNISFGNTRIAQSEIEAAANAANAHAFIEQLPDGYDTNIGDRGSKLSGGQRQRLTIARALLKNPPILILDEATSALDSESEQLVQAALDHLLTNRTALVIAHRLSTVQHADEIIVMDQGQIAERGTHESLMQQGGIYRKLVELQAL